MIVFLGNAGTLPEDTPAPIAFGYLVIILALLSMGTPVVWSGFWLMLMLFGIPVDWQVGFRIFIVLVVAGSVAIWLRHRYNTKKRIESINQNN